jgi:hypothetical protein
MLYPIELETAGAVLVLWELEPGLPLEPYCRCDGGRGDEQAVIDELAAEAPAGVTFTIDRANPDRWLCAAPSHAARRRRGRPCHSAVRGMPPIWARPTL